jgi:oligopeptidase B
MTPDANTATPSRPESETNANSPVAPQPPVARRHAVEHVIHGDRRIDNYAWLREKQNPEVIAYLNAENAYTDAVLHDTEAFQEKLYQEMLGRILQTDLSVPYRLRGYS